MIVGSVGVQSFSGVFRISPYSVQMRENMDFRLDVINREQLLALNDA